MPEHFETFESSVFMYTPRSKKSFPAYWQDFNRHKSTRAMVISNALYYSDSRESHWDILDRTIPFIEKIAETNDRVVFLSMAMPVWLSSSDDEGKIDAVTQRRHTVPPKDYAPWLSSNPMSQVSGLMGDQQ
ncbi:hypothetical protein ACFL1X_03605 [Candidatus Hydrogenedentota bacterium]